MITAVADRSAEQHFLTGKDRGRYPREFLAKATKVTAVEADSHEEPIWI